MFWNVQKSRDKALCFLGGGIGDRLYWAGSWPETVAVPSPVIQGAVYMQRHSQHCEQGWGNQGEIALCPRAVTSGSRYLPRPDGESQGHCWGNTAPDVTER